MDMFQVLQESSQIISLLHSYQIDSKSSETFSSLAEHFLQITENSDDQIAKYTIKNYGLDNQEKFRWGEAGTGESLSI